MIVADAPSAQLEEAHDPVGRTSEEHTDQRFTIDVTQARLELPGCNESGGTRTICDVRKAKLAR